MSQRLCPSCGHQNSDAVVYCVHCGAILGNAPVPAEGQPLSTSVAVAARRVDKVPVNSAERRSIGSRLLGLFVYVVCVALGVGTVLALMNPKAGQPAALPEARRVQNPAGVIQQQILSSRFTPSSVSQQLINDFLKASGSIDWNAPALIPSSVWPKWESAHVELGTGVITATVEATLLGYPLHFSETFKLVGSSRQWGLDPDSGTIGLLPISKPFLPLITLFVQSCSRPLAREIKSLESADSLQIRAGFIDFTTR